MLFSEVYGAYFRVLSGILERAVAGSLTREEMYAVIREKGFEESILTIPQNLADQTWPLLLPDLTTPLRYPPAQPVTTLQKRWLKALLADPRIRLFDPPAQGLEDVTPLYGPDAFVWFDRYSDGDPFEDPGYIARFRTILTGVRENRWLQVRFLGRNQTPYDWKCLPRKLEYSPKDDKFRLLAVTEAGTRTVNLGRITHCALLEACAEAPVPPAQPRQALVLELTDQRNSLDRCMLHFSDLEKETVRVGENRYLLTLYYKPGDESELLIRVLSFGPSLKVLSPADFRDRLRARLHTQLNLRTQE